MHKVCVYVCVSVCVCERERERVCVCVCVCDVVRALPGLSQLMHTFQKS